MAVLDLARFSHVELELAGEMLTMREIAAALCRSLKLTIEAPMYTPAEALALGAFPIVALRARIPH